MTAGSISEVRKVDRRHPELLKESGDVALGDGPDAHERFADLAAFLAGASGRSPAAPA
jgi:hypothetical protein